MGWEFSYVHFSISLCYEGITEKIFHSALCMQRIIDDRQSLNWTHFQTRKRRARCEVNKAFCIQDRCIKCIMQSTHRERMINRQSAFDWFDFDYFLQRPHMNVQHFAPQQSTYLLCVHLLYALHCRYLLMEISIL